jgi:ubiquinone/menaquinone biosynthesis C-methylase UbiE
MSTKRNSFVARAYDVFMLPQERLGLRSQRARLCRSADGRVLEIAIGTGLTIRHYRDADSVVGIDYDPSMLRRAIPRTWESKVSVRLVAADAHALPFPDLSFESIVIALSLCTIPNPAGALKEFGRVATPGARLHFLEHVRPARPARIRLQNRLSPAWERVSGGCRLNQDTQQLIDESTWSIDSLWASNGGGLIQGTARKL